MTNNISPVTSQKPSPQSFRVAPWCQTSSSSSRPGIVKIPAVRDPVTGNHVVLWRDILLLFPDAQYILDIDVLVVFEETANFEQLAPPRILCHEGKVLDVVLFSTTSTSTETCALPAVMATLPVETLPPPPETVASPIKTSPPSVKTPTIPVKTSAPPVKKPTLPVETSTPHAKTFSQLAETSAPGKTSPLPEETSASSAKGNTVRNQPFSPEESTITKLSVHDKGGTISPTPRPKVISKWPPYKTIPLKDIQFQIPGIFPHTKTWSTARTSRLFILLPSATAAAAAQLCPPYGPHQQISSNQLRLYFFCDSYDDHLTQERSHWVHLSQHVGYRIARPSELLEEFGAYILVVMEAVRKGFEQGSESNCTPAAKMAHELNQLEQEEISLWKSKQSSPTRNNNESIYTEDSVTAMLDATIIYLKDLAQRNPKTWRKTDKLDDSSWKDWEGMWSHIETELKNSIPIPDTSYQLFGNLYQCISSSGHSQLICKKHAQLHHQDEALPTSFKGMVGEGLFGGHLSLLIFDLPSRMQARTLHDILIRAKTVHDLHVTFKWDVSMTDLQDFSAAVLRSTVLDIDLTLKVPGTNTAPLLFATNITMSEERARRHAPLLGMLARGKLESFRISGLPGLFWSTKSLQATKAFPTLRSLEAKEETKIDSLTLKKCTALKMVRMGYIHILYLTLNEKLDFISACPTLETIELFFTSNDYMLYLKHPGSYFQQLFQFLELVVKLKTTKEKNTRLSLSSLQIRFLEGSYLFLNFVTEDDGTCSPRISINPIAGAECLQPILADLVKKYGWAIRDLMIGASWDPLNVRALLQSIDDKVGKDGVTYLETLELPRCPLHFNEMVPLRRILERSPRLKLLSVPLNCAGVDRWRPETSRHDYLRWVVQYMGPWLTHLELHDCIGWEAGSTMSRLLHKSSLPKLEHLRVSFIEDLVNDLDWLSDMIASHASPYTEAVATAAPFGPRPLSFLVLNRVNSKVKSHDPWKKILEAIDFSVLKFLLITNSATFGEEQWKMLLGFLPKDGVLPDGTLVPLQQILVKGTSLGEGNDQSRADQLLKQAPLAQLTQDL